VDTDILKPDTGYLAIIERPTNTASGTGTGSSKGSDYHASGSHSPAEDKYVEPVSEGEEDEDRDLAPAKDEDKRTGLSGKEVEEAIAYREQMLREQRENGGHTSNGLSKKRARLADLREERDSGDEEGEDVDARTPFLKGRRDVLSKPRALSIDPLAPSTAFDETLRDRLKGEQEARKLQQLNAPETAEGDGDGDEDEEVQAAMLGGERLLTREWRAPAGKRISVPVRIEPKVYFAAERTFLKWLNTAVFIGTIATTLLNFTSPEDSGGLISAAVFTFAALLAIAYSAGIFVYRAYRLRAHRAEGLYYDKYGPTILCLVLFAALATNIGLRVSEMLTETETET